MDQAREDDDDKEAAGESQGRASQPRFSGKGDRNGSVYRARSYLDSKAQRIEKLNYYSYRPRYLQRRRDHEPSESAPDSEIEKPLRRNTRRRRRNRAKKTAKVENPSKNQSAVKPAPTTDSEYGEAPTEDVMACSKDLPPETMPLEFNLALRPAPDPATTTATQTPSTPSTPSKPQTYYTLNNEQDLT